MRCRPSVLSRPPEVFYRNHLLKPYVFFDVAGGRDIRASDALNAGSRRNQACALFLLCCYCPCLPGSACRGETL